METKELEVSTAQGGETVVKKNFGAKLGEFFDRNYALFFAPIIVLVIYLTALMQNNVYPFSDQYTSASYDLSAQICPFIEHLFDVIDGRSSLFYTYAIAGGADVYGTFAYFFVSPFSFLFLILGDTMVARACTFVMAAKLATMAVAGAWFAKKVFQNIPDYLCIAIGVVYTYCGYTFVSNTYINWMDFLIYLPFCAGAFKHFIQTGKFLPFSILVACCIYTCFSIASFSLFIAFPIVIAYVVLCVEKEKRNKTLAYACLAFVVAIVIALPILVPSLLAYLNSGRSSGGIFENLYYGLTMSNGEYISVNSSSFFEKYETSLYRKLAYVLSDSIFLLLTFAWFCKKDFKERFVKFMLLAGALTLIPVIVDESMLLLNMGSYMSYAHRFGFLNALYFLGGACLCIDEAFAAQKAKAENAAKPALVLEEEVGEQTENDGDMVEAKETVEAKFQWTAKYTWTTVFAVVGALVVGFLLWFMYNDHYKGKAFWELLGMTSDEIKGISGFSAKFAHSLGGLEVIVVLFIAVAIVAGVGFLLFYKKKIGLRTLSIVLLVVVGAQVLFYNNQLVIGNRSEQHVKMDDYTTLSRQLNEMEEEENGYLPYFRIKDYGRIVSKDSTTNERTDCITANIPFMADSNSFSVFSSVIESKNFTVLNLFGYLSNVKNNLKSVHWQQLNKDGTEKNPNRNGSEEFGDAFLGYKYFFVKKNQLSTVNKLGYAEKVMVEDENGNKVHLSAGKDSETYYMYENTLVFPSAYVLPKGSFTFAKSNINNSSHRKANQAALYEFLRGKTLEDMQEVTGSSSSEYVTVETTRELSEYLWDRAADVRVGKAEITATVTSTEEGGGYLFMNFVASTGYTVTVNGKEVELVGNDLEFLCVPLDEGENVVKFTYTSPYAKYTFVSIAASVVLLAAIWLVLNKTKVMQYCENVIAWAGIVVAIAVVVFFMVYPTIVFVSKWLLLAETYIREKIEAGVVHWFLRL